ncbi:hypothetical protein KI387_016774, partial [Taxus chinensis]
MRPLIRHSCKWTTAGMLCLCLRLGSFDLVSLKFNGGVGFLSIFVIMENDGAVEIGLNVASASRNFGPDQSLDTQSTEENSQHQNPQPLRLNGRHNEIQSNQQIPLQNHKHMQPNGIATLQPQHNLLQNLHFQQLQQNSHQNPQNFQNQAGYEQNSQIQRNVVHNQQNMEASARFQYSQHNAHVVQHQQVAALRGAHIVQNSSSSSSSQGLQHQKHLISVGSHENEEESMEASSHDFHRDMRDLEDLLSKLNPMAKEFVPPSLLSHASAISFADAFIYNNNNTNVVNGTTSAINININNRRRKNNYQGKNRMNSRTSIAQREDSIRRTVYVSDIDQQVTEEQLAALFINCGQVVDCRVCGDPNSVLRFAFVEFTREEEARAALSLAGTMLGYYPVRVLPSKTAIAPVNPTFLPRSEDEREMCARTIYCTNIDKKVSQADVKLFFESLCGEVSRLRLLGDYHHSTRIAFVEFIMAESAIAALNCSGAILGSLPI